MKKQRKMMKGRKKLIRIGKREKRQNRSKFRILKKKENKWKEEENDDVHCKIGVNEREIQLFYYDSLSCCRYCWAGEWYYFFLSIFDVIAIFALLLVVKRCILVLVHADVRWNMKVVYWKQVYNLSIVKAPSKKLDK